MPVHLGNAAISLTESPDICPIVDLERRIAATGVLEAAVNPDLHVNRPLATGPSEWQRPSTSRVRRPTEVTFRLADERTTRACWSCCRRARSRNLEVPEREMTVAAAMVSTSGVSPRQGLRIAR